MPNDPKAIGYPSNSLKTTFSSGKNYVLAIGIDAYTHCPTLHNAVKDAQDFVTLLTNRYAFDSDHMSFITTGTKTTCLFDYTRSLRIDLLRLLCKTAATRMTALASL